MEIKHLRHREEWVHNSKLNNIQIQFTELLKELHSKNLPVRTVVTINKYIEELNSSLLSGNGSKDYSSKSRLKSPNYLKKNTNWFLRIIIGIYGWF